jgi:metal-sulfur cluster biosynthetic enzyme
MSDPINANPTILDESELPTRIPLKTVRDDILKFASSPIFAFSLFDNHYSARAPQTESPISSYAPSLISDSEDVDEPEPIDAQEIYDLISSISDPEHPLTLGQLAVVNLPDITVIDDGDSEKMAEVIVEITPTITHCSLATLIGLGIRVRLDRCLPPRYRITINVKKGTHQSENQVNKQLNDKERVAAACENEQLLTVISNMLSTCK